MPPNVADYPCGPMSLLLAPCATRVLLSWSGGPGSKTLVAQGTRKKSKDMTLLLRESAFAICKEISSVQKNVV